MYTAIRQLLGGKILNVTAPDYLVVLLSVFFFFLGGFKWRVTYLDQICVEF